MIKLFRQMETPEVHVCSAAWARKRIAFVKKNKTIASRRHVQDLQTVVYML